MSSKEKGKEAEAKACKYLEDYDFIIIETNFFAKKLDISYCLDVIIIVDNDIDLISNITI